MKNIFLIAACFAMCGTAVASSGTGVIAKSEIVVDVGHELAVTAEMQVPCYEYTLVKSASEFVTEVTVVGTGLNFESADVEVANPFIEIAGREKWRQPKDRRSTLTNGLADKDVERTDTLNCRRARDGLTS
jgi:hypothetical protein